MYFRYFLSPTTSNNVDLTVANLSIILETIALSFTFLMRLHALIVWNTLYLSSRRLWPKRLSAGCMSFPIPPMIHYMIGNRVGKVNYITWNDSYLYLHGQMYEGLEPVIATAIFQLWNFGDRVTTCHLAPTPVNFPVSHPKGVFKLPPRVPRPPPPSDNGFDDI